ncbi:hypothetical protein KC349_g219 [Hortaea werneckii]|nr:hypothetical protein KC349_g219 [Hortaea werneckii]
MTMSSTARHRVAYQLRAWQKWSILLPCLRTISRFAQPIEQRPRKHKRHEPSKHVSYPEIPYWSEEVGLGVALSLQQVDKRGDEDRAKHVEDEPRLDFGFRYHLVKTAATLSSSTYAGIVLDAFLHYRVDRQLPLVNHDATLIGVLVGLDDKVALDPVMSRGRASWQNGRVARVKISASHGI